MKTRTKWLVTGLAAVALVGAGTGVAVAAGSNESADHPITGPDLTRATSAALASTHGGRVTETENGDEESKYQVEVTLSNGRKVDVQLDASFAVVGSKTDGEGSSDSGG
jgi:hypothetical protein